MPKVCPCAYCKRQQSYKKNLSQILRILHSLNIYHIHTIIDYVHLSVIFTMQEAAIHPWLCHLRHIQKYSN